jgi:poly(ADP-ribose) glycohydrolase ARH3
MLAEGDKITPKMVAATLGNGMAAIDSCVTAIYIALAFREKCFEELLTFAIKVGGDVDTIAAMAGAIWGADRGHQGLPQARLDHLEDYKRLEKLTYSLSQVIAI